MKVLPYFNMLKSQTARELSWLLSMGYVERAADCAARLIAGAY